MTFSFFRILWILFQVVLSAVNFIEYLWITIRRKWEKKFYKQFIENDGIVHISRSVKYITKIPSHFVVIVGNESISYKDLANITIWSLAAGISFISFYDYNGILKKNEAELFKVLSDTKKGHIENIIWGNKTKTGGLIRKNGTRNGINSTQHKLCINIFSLSDGKGTLVELTKSLCEQALSGQVKSSEINQDYIDENLETAIGIPDPDLAICCGDTCSIFGFLPWQIRVTEFMQLQSHHNIKVKDFTAILEKYGKCIQRFGK